jgi:TolA-binding protein
MNRHLAALLIAAVLLPFPSARAQADAEDLRRLNGTVENLNEGQESLRRQVQELRDQLAQMRTENAQLKQELASGRDVVTREQLNQVVEQLREVDRKRVADAEYVKGQLADIARDVNKSLAAAKETARPKPTVKPAANGGAANGSAAVEHKQPDEVYEHIVKSGETLDAIILAYNKQNNLKVTQAQVLEANPTLKDPRRLRAGQKLIIPAIK